jgi:hypothetical protein
MDGKGTTPGGVEIIYKDQLSRIYIKESLVLQPYNIFSYFSCVMAISIAAKVLRLVQIWSYLV